MYRLKQLSCDLSCKTCQHDDVGWHVAFMCPNRRKIGSRREKADWDLNCENHATQSQTPHILITEVVIIVVHDCPLNKYFWCVDRISRKLPFKVFVAIHGCHIIQMWPISTVRDHTGRLLKHMIPLTIRADCYLLHLSCELFFLSAGEVGLALNLVPLVILVHCYSEENRLICVCVCVVEHASSILY